MPSSLHRHHLPLFDFADGLFAWPRPVVHHLTGRGLAEALNALLKTLQSRIQVTPVRLPHREMMPNVRQAVTTLAIQDQKREGELPHARMYYLEEIAATQTQVERQIIMEPSDFDDTDRKNLRIVKQWAKRVAWEDYQARFTPP